MAQRNLRALGLAFVAPNPRLQPTWLIDAFSQVLTRIGVDFIAKVLTTQPPSG